MILCIVKFHKLDPKEKDGYEKYSIGFILNGIFMTVFCFPAIKYTIESNTHVFRFFNSTNALVILYIQIFSIVGVISDAFIIFQFNEPAFGYCRATCHSLDLLR